MTLVQFSVSLGQGKKENKRPQKLRKTMNNSLKTFLSLSILVGVVSAASLRPKHYGPLPRYNFHTHKYTKNSNHDLTILLEAGCKSFKPRLANRDLLLLSWSRTLITGCPPLTRFSLPQIPQP